MNLWNCEFEKPIVTDYAPGVSEDAVMVVSDERVVRIHREHGEIVCILPTDIPISAKPILKTWVEAGKGVPVIYVPSYADGNLWALKIRRLKRSLASPVRGGESVIYYDYISSRGWNRGVPKGAGHILAPLSKLGNLIFMCTTSRTVMAVKESSGIPLWRIQTMGAVDGGICASGENVCFGASDFKLYCVDRLTGEKQWELPTGGAIASRPMADGEGCVVVCYSELVGLVAADAKTGKKLWVSRSARKILGIGLKIVYALDARGRLMAIGKKDGKVAWKSETGFAKIFTCEEQYENPQAPLYLVAATRDNEIVCLVEPGFKPKMVTGLIKKVNPGDVKVIKGAEGEAGKK